MRRLSRSERFLAAAFVDVAFAALLVVLCVEDKITPTMCMTSLSALALARVRPVELGDDDDDDDDDKPRGSRGRFSAVSGVLTLIGGVFLGIQWVRQKVGV